MAAFITHPGAHASFATAEQKAGLLDVAKGSSGTEWVYVQANGAIDAYDAVMIDEDGQAAALTNTTAAADDGGRIGVVQCAFADNEFGWAAIAGSDISVNVLASVSADIDLWTSSTAGTLNDASASAGNMKILGAVVVTANVSAGTVECVLQYPRLVIGT